MHTFILFIKLFLFIPSVHHLTLHSFPTRRSSDLRRNKFALCIRRRRPRYADRPSSRTPDLSPDAHAKDPVCGMTVEDRKSTRLNSSHITISYAVFCLKKKKKIL